MDQPRMLLEPGDFSGMVPIGRGKDSIIYAAQCAKLGGQVAVKVYQKSRTSASKLRAIKREAAMMVYLARKSVPSITAYHGAFQTANEICIVMEYCPRGDLLEHLLAEGRAFSEARVAQVAATLLATLQRMHALAIIHRDVKLENIFIGEAGHLRLGDFGLTMSMKQESAISPVGTVEYMAPEVVALPRVELVASGKVDPASIAACDSGVDVWALGITLYELLSGHLPFDGRDKTHIKKAISAGAMRPLPAGVSQEAASFVGAMLEPDRRLRASAADLLEHPFLSARGPRGACNSPRSVLPPVADATAYIHAETSPWPTKGGTACIEVVSQPKAGAPYLSIPESPEQLKGDSPHSAPRSQLVTPVAFWNSDMATPDAAPDGPPVQAALGRDQLLTPAFPVVSPSSPAPTPALFGAKRRQPPAAEVPELAPSLQQPDNHASRDSLPLQSCLPPAPARASSRAQQTQPPPPDTAPHKAAPQHSPSRLSQMTLPTNGQASLLAPYAPAACCDGSGRFMDHEDSVEEELSWRTGLVHSDGLPWSPGRLLSKFSQYFRPAAATAH